MGKENNTKQYDNINKALFIGQKVKHISFGEGTIADIKDGFIFVDFYNKPMRQFDFPSVFSSYLAPVSDYISNFVKELYGNHTCLRCGVAIINGSNKTICDRCKSKLKICPICKNKAFVRSVEELNQYRSRYEDEVLFCSNCYYKFYINQKDETSTKSSSPERISSTTDFNVEKHTLYIHYGNNIKCKKDNHNVICVNAKVPTMDQSKTTVNVNFCTECHKFFIENTQYESYIKRYRVLYVRFNYVNKDGDFPKSDVHSSAEKSPLMLCGYSVSQEKGYSNIERQKILKDIIEHKILPKSRVIDYLYYFIEFNGMKDNMDLAVSKWEEDVEYVESYDKENQLNVNIDKISRYGFK